MTGFHREIAREALPKVVVPAVREICELSAELSLAVALGARVFGENGEKYIAHLLVNEHGATVASIEKQGLTVAEATFFSRGRGRPVGLLQGLRCSAVICREVEDAELVTAELPLGSVDMVFIPGALRQDPEKPKANPPQFVRNIQRIAQLTGASVIQTNWPNALNRPEESVDGGGSIVCAPDGAIMFRLPLQEAGVGVFTLGEDRFLWQPQ